MPLKPAVLGAKLFVNKLSSSSSSLSSSSSSSSSGAGGRWQFPLRLVAGFPHPDDTIQLEAGVQQAAAVTFTLCRRGGGGGGGGSGDDNGNVSGGGGDDDDDAGGASAVDGSGADASLFASASPHAFRAYLTPDTAAEFTVTPEQGVLAPARAGGTKFVVNFAPSEYGKNKQGCLVIETRDFLWSYKLVGKHPVYHPPKGASRYREDPTFTRTHAAASAGAARNSVTLSSSMTGKRKPATQARR